MPTYTEEIYNTDPWGVLSQTISNTSVWEGTAAPSGEATVTGNEPDSEGLTPGTMIQTDQGDRAIESLKVGDMVMTRDHGAQPVRWIGTSTVPGQGKLAPVRVASHVTGARRSLLVSPQHRMLFEGYECELLFGIDEVLAAATFLEDGYTVKREPHLLVTYIHLMLDQHEIIYAEGAATESFYPDDVCFGTVSGQAREDLFAAFPALRDDLRSYGETARVCLKAHEARLLMQERITLPMAA